MVLMAAETTRNVKNDPILAHLAVHGHLQVPRRQRVRIERLGGSVKARGAVPVRGAGRVAGRVPRPQRLGRGVGVGRPRDERVLRNLPGDAGGGAPAGGRAARPPGGRRFPPVHHLEAEGDPPRHGQVHLQGRRRDDRLRGHAPAVEGVQGGDDDLVVADVLPTEPGRRQGLLRHQKFQQRVGLGE